MFHFGPTWGIKDEKVIPLLWNFEMNLMPILFYYIFQVKAQ